MAGRSRNRELGEELAGVGLRATEQRVGVLRLLRRLESHPTPGELAFYDRGGNPNPWLDGGMRPLNLTEEERADLVALLETFTSEDLQRFEALKALMP